MNDYFSASEIFDENHLIFFPISGSLLAYLRCIYITSCFPSKILMLSKQCARVSWFVLITFIINEVFYIDRTTNLSPWSCNVAMVALIVKKKTNPVWLQFFRHFWTSISRRQTEKCRSYNPSKRIGFPNNETIWTLTNFCSRLIWPKLLATSDPQ